MKPIKLIRTTTIPQALKILLRGQHRFMREKGFEVVGVASNHQDLIDVANAEGIRTIAVDMERHIRPFKDLISLWKMYCVFRKEKPTIVHSMTAKAGLLSMLAGKMAGVPIRMHTFAGLMFHAKKPLKRKIIITMDKVLCWAATNVYPEGEGIKREMITHNITSKPLKVLANGNVNGINTSYFCPTQITEKQKNELRSQWEISESDFIFIFVGRVVGDKGINELVQAFTNLTNHLPIVAIGTPTNNLKLLIVGGKESDLDPLHPNTIKLINENPHIKEVGFQEDVRPFFAIANALVLPSYREGMPNAVIQAGAMELPSVVSDVIGCNEIITHNFNGLIIPPKDIKKLEESMWHLAQNTELYNRLKANCRKPIVNRFEQEVVWNAILEEYHRLLKERGMS